MKKNHAITLWGFMILLFVCSTTTWGTISDQIPQHYDVNLTPSSQLQAGSPISFMLEFDLKDDFIQQADEVVDVNIWLIPFLDQGVILDEQKNTIQHNKAGSNSLEFDVTIPDKNVFVIRVEIVSGQSGYLRDYLIASTNDEIQFDVSRKEVDFSKVKKTQPIVSTKIPFDKLTHNQKQLLFKFGVDLSTQQNRDFVEGIVGEVPESSLSNPARKGYTISTTLENAKKIAEEGIEIDFVKKRPRWKYIEVKDEYEIIQDPVEIE